MLSNNFFHTNVLIVLKILTVYKISFFNDGVFKIGHFDIFDKLFLFLVFVKL